MIFMPYLIGGLLLGYIWQFILGDCMATLGEMTGRTDLFFYWLSNKQFAFIGLIVVATWQMAGYMMIIYIAGLQSISDDVLEAASVDGASYWQTLFRIRLPLLMPSITICLFLTLSNCFKIYDVNLALTGGGPANATEMVSMNIFNEIFAKSNYGYGQAKAIVFFIIVGRDHHVPGPAHVQAGGGGMNKNVAKSIKSVLANMALLVFCPDLPLPDLYHRGQFLQKPRRDVYQRAGPA